MWLLSFATYIWRHAAKEHRGAPRAPGRGAADAYGALRSLGLDNPPSLLVGALGMLREGGWLPTQRSISYSIQVVQDHAGIHIYVNVGRKII